jgi:inositol phosphorylceramide mannosyltransferase catalytic subunit
MSISESISTAVFGDGPVVPGIPKSIYQVYATKNLPEALQENVKRIRDLNPGWNYRLFDDGEMIDFIREAYGESMLSKYLRINPRYGAARADLFRYLLIYKCGGVYLDVKSSLTKPLDDVLRSDDVYILSKWSSGKDGSFEGWGRHAQLKDIGGEEFQQWHVIAASNHPFLRAVIDNVLSNVERYNPILHDTGKDGVLGLTGPIVYTRAITPLLTKHPHRRVNGQDDIGLVYSIFGSAVARMHKAIFRVHYTELNEPVVQLYGFRKLVWTIYRPFHIYFAKPIESKYRSLLRRIRQRLGLVATDT